jgi:iron complex outermembrane receptor protein
MKQYNTNKGIEQIIPNYEMLDAGGFIYAQKNFPTLSISGGMRYDTRNLKTENLLSGTDIKSEAFKKQFSNFSGSIGIAHPLSKQFNVKVNIARAYRAPSIPELASNGAHEGTFRYEYGNLQLKNETSFQFDGGLEFSATHLSMNVTAFYNNFNNFIFYSKLSNASGGDSLVNIDGENLNAYQFNQQGAVIQGIEATLDIHPHPLDWLHIENTFSILNGQFKNSIGNSKYLPFMPAARILSEVRANIDKVKKNIKNLYCKVELDNIFNQRNVFTTFNTETATSGYSLVNVGIGAEITSRKNKQLFNIYFSGNNLTDVAYQNHLSRLKYTAVNMITGRTGVFNMGRNFSIKILIPFSKNLKAK